MYRQGKYTKKRGPINATKRFLKRRWRWYKQLPIWKKIAYPLTPVVLFAVIVPIATYLYFARDISNVDRLLNRNNTGVVLMDHKGKVFYQTPGARSGHREMVPIDKISPYVKHALVASEDKDFYKHSGFSMLSTARAVYGYVIHGGGSFGGSTITQQLAKITVLSSQRSFLRQYQAFSIAVALENKYSKDQILEMYLNSVYFGENAFGIEDAAKAYFNTMPDKLTLAQSAMIIGVLPAPSAYSPISGNATYAKERQTYVLNQMVKSGFITNAEKDAALTEELHYAKPKNAIDNAAPHFTEMVLDELYQKYGQEKVLRSGYQVKTTLDLSLQKKANQAVADNIANVRLYGGSNASLISIDPQSGGIRALVGSANYNNKKWGQVNMTTTPRQPGSSFKPIYYSAALAEGVVTPATVLQDTAAARNKFPDYTTVNNYDRSFRGNVTTRQALNWSLNIPAVEVMQKLTIPDAVEAAKRVGITTMKSADSYGLALALGAQEAPLDEMTNAYASFGNGGRQYALSSIQSIEDKYDKPIYTMSKDSKQVISEQGAYLISNILSDNATRARMFGSLLNVVGTDGLTKTVAVKTGTTENSHDAWTIGYTPDIATGVWVGNNDNTAMASSGGEMAGPIWRQFMGQAIGTAKPKFTQPSGVTKATVCTAMGSMTDYFLSSKVPERCQTEAPSQQKQPTQKVEKCTIAGKTALDADDPNCKEEMCTIPGLTQYAANDPKCDAADSDNDGVPDAIDQCQDTPPGATVDDVGCSTAQSPGGSGSNGNSGSSGNGNGSGNSRRNN